ncbi:MAG: tetratricopeptide repeat-containing protein [Candidatus Solibacter sp.]
MLDLDKSYRYIIKPAAEAAGYECVRADEIQHAGNINVPMYQQLLNADVVIADVSTYNPNAFYELGVRHALKPYTTITIAEDKLVFPFDVGQIAIRTYRHMGEGIDFGEVERMRSELEKAIRIVGEQAACDSPVYTFLRDLRPPALAKAEVERALAASAPADSAPQPTIRTLMDQADAAIDKSDFITAKSLLAIVRTMMPMDSYVAQRLALATYKSKLPNPEAALNEAAVILETLAPATSTDTETLGLYGAVHKLLWDATGVPAHLDRAIWAHEKGLYVKNDYYNGINLAFLLNVRSALSGSEPAEAIADFVTARRIRRRVLALCQTLLDATPVPQGPDRYWIKATIAEAHAGVGDDTRAKELLEDAKAQPGVASWMIRSTEERLEKLREILTKSPMPRIGPSSGA